MFLHPAVTVCRRPNRQAGQLLVGISPGNLQQVLEKLVFAILLTSYLFLNSGSKNHYM